MSVNTALSPGAGNREEDYLLYRGHCFGLELIPFSTRHRSFRLQPVRPAPKGGQGGPSFSHLQEAQLAQGLR